MRSSSAPAVASSWLALSMSACVINPSPPAVDVTWTIERLQGGEVACPSDWATVVVMVEDQAGTTTIAQRFACGDLGGSISARARGARAWLEVRDPQDRTVATSLPYDLDADGFFPIPFDAHIYLDAGYAQLTWTWKDTPWCSDSFNPFEVVHLTFTGPTSYTQLLDCESGIARSEPLAAGTYSLSIGQGFSSTTLSNVEIEAPNKITELSVTM
jgi:hypothetical protein